MRHLLTVFDLTADEIGDIFELSGKLKGQLADGVREPLLAGHVLALLFEKPSLRTRVSFEAGISHLGGTSMYLGKDVGWGDRESPADFSRVLSQYVDLIVCRAKQHDKVEQLAQYATCPIINGLTDVSHPCQALADLLTMREVHGALDGKKLAFVGDGNNVARSLAVVCGLLGMRFVLSAPAGYRFKKSFRRHLDEILPEAEIVEVDDPREAVAGAAAVYTDVWASMGQEKQRAKRVKDFAAYRVDAALMRLAPDAVFMHCLPARRGEEVTDEVIDGPQSVVVEQAANRMHLQKGLVAWLLGRQV